MKQFKVEYIQIFPTNVLQLTVDANGRKELNRMIKNILNDEKTKELKIILL